MPDPLDFEKVRWKLADDLSTDEIDVIVQNKEKLNDEEKAAFAGVLQAAQPLGDNPLEDAINDAVDDPSNQTPPVDPANPDPANPTPPAQAAPVVAPVTPAPTPTVPQTQEQLDAYLDKKKQEWDAAGKSKEDQKKETEKIQQFFDAGYQPKDWNDYTQAMFDKIAPVIEQRVIARLEAQNKTFQDQQAKIKATQQEIFDRFEKEFHTLATSKLIPDPTTQPEEYKKVHDAIIKIGDENGKATVTDAYKLWSIIPTEHGGGLVVANAPVVDPLAAEKAKQVAQRNAAGRISSARGAPAGGGKPAAKPWHEVHSTSMEDLLEARLAQP